MNQAEYTAYLQTEHWRLMRAAALDRAEHRCQLCYSPRQLEVHHRTYERVGWEHASDLTVLCSGCHGLFHDVLEAVQRQAFAPAASRTPNYLAIARGKEPCVPR